MYRTLRELGFEPMLRMYYHEWEPYWVTESLNGHAVVVDRIVDFSQWRWGEPDELSIPEVVPDMGGQLMHTEDLRTEEMCYALWGVRPIGKESCTEDEMLTSQYPTCDLV